MSNNSNVIKLTGLRGGAPKSERSRMETQFVTVAGAQAWKKPPFQREFRLTAKFQQVVEQIKRDEVVEGVITLGEVRGTPGILLIDGQHRREAFLMTGLQEVLADIRICQFDNMDEAAAEFIRLNSPIARMQTDDILRAMEGSNEHIAMIRRRCPFVGYSNVRKGGKNAREDGTSKILLSMSVVVRCWVASKRMPDFGTSSTISAGALDKEDTASLVGFLSSCFEAWGPDKTNFHLWGSLNISLLMWLYRQVVLGQRPQSATGDARFTTLTGPEFTKCMMTLSADATYADWMVGRSLSPRDRTAGYQRIKVAFARRLADLGKRGARFPQPVGW